MSGDAGYARSPSAAVLGRALLRALLRVPAAGDLVVLPLVARVALAQALTTEILSHHLV
ncbi:MAG: hypothetical protein M3Z06_14550 [Actinomycetota bacterium]|nr:hypothetical protein [Actinomycetota bacterium]